MSVELMRESIRCADAAISCNLEAEKRPNVNKQNACCQADILLDQ